MARKRRLSDLYVVGKEVTFDDGSGDPIKVFVRKLNPIDHETAVKHANAARARVMALINDTDSVAYQDIWGDVLDMPRDMLIAYLAEEERSNRIPVVESEIANDEEWVNDSYLQGLQDAWTGGLAEKYATNPEDEEAAHVFQELERFVSTVENEVNGHVDNFIADLETLPDHALRARVMERMIQVRGNAAWFAEFRRCQMWLSVREPDKKTRYFQARSEVDELPIEVSARLAETYQELSIEPTEGKDSRVKDDSSVSSE